MTEGAQRKSWWKSAVLAVVAIEAAGGLSGWLSNSGYGNVWFDTLAKPSFMPPGWIFGLVWPILYALLGIAVAMIAAEPSSERRRLGLTLFVVQLALNLAWSPIFFAAHSIAIAKWLVFIIAIVAAAAAGQFYRVRKPAGLLMIPYLAWLVFAAALSASIEALNGGANRLLV